jgi:hypothetical protein
MRGLSYILIAAGLILAGRAAFDEHRGITTEPVIEAGSIILEYGKVAKSENPNGFQNDMNFHWLYACLTLGAGLILLQIIRKEDRLDPLAPDCDRKDEE